jgi:hypothetical protein
MWEWAGGRRLGPVFLASLALLNAADALRYAPDYLVCHPIRPADGKLSAADG